MDEYEYVPVKIPMNKNPVMHHQKRPDMAVRTRDNRHNVKPRQERRNKYFTTTVKAEREVLKSDEIVAAVHDLHDVSPFKAKNA